MSARVTERELFDRCYGAAHTATDLLQRMAGDVAAGHRPDATPEQLKQVRDALREALCAVQELKTREKLNRQGAKSAKA